MGHIFIKSFLQKNYKRKEISYNINIVNMVKNMKVIITGAGKGSRFLEKGINLPKYLIKANGKTLLEYSLLTLSDFYSSEFIFIFRDLEDETKVRQIINSCKNYNGEKILNYKIININFLTKGQAETVLSIKDSLIKDDSILIFNVDTFVANSYNYIKKEDINSLVDGVIYTTKSTGDHWSFAKTKLNSNKVIEVSEKVRISENASIGLYYFKSFNEFQNILLKYEKDIIKNNKELYIMPIYKYLIEEGKEIILKDIPFDNFIPLGTPNEILEFDKDFLEENVNV